MQGDFEFLKRCTKLNDFDLASLLDSDADLLLKSITLTNETLINISLPLFVRISIVRKSKFPEKENIYVSDAVACSYPKIFRASPYVIDRGSFREEDAKFFLVCVGLFPERFNRKNRPLPPIRYYIEAARTGFSKAEQDEVADHIYDWVDILHQVKESWHITSSSTIEI